STFLAQVFIYSNVHITSICINDVYSVHLVHETCHCYIFFFTLQLLVCQCIPPKVFGCIINGILEKGNDYCTELDWWGSLLITVFSVFHGKCSIILKSEEPILGYKN
ncbi:hypothetical protein Leryth_000589, partial [Lithospermum erythrorhizon]